MPALAGPVIGSFAQAAYADSPIDHQEATMPTEPGISDLLPLRKGSLRR